MVKLNSWLFISDLEYTCHNSLKPHITLQNVISDCVVWAFFICCKVGNRFAFCHSKHTHFYQFGLLFWLGDWKCIEKFMKDDAPQVTCSSSNQSRSCIGWTVGGKVYLRLRRDSTFWNPFFEARNNLHARPISVKVLNMYKSTPV